MSRKRHSNWQSRQARDPFVRKAESDGYRSRAVYKLDEIARRERFLKAGMCCVDLGASPGGWSQYVARALNDKVHLIAFDLLPMEPLAGVQFIQGDFTDDAALQQLDDLLNDRDVDLVLSDMAPNLSGNKSVDQPRSMYLAELALDFARQRLRDGGNFVCKVFQGQGSEAFFAESRRSFKTVKAVKPKASRPESSEIYLVARNYYLV